MKTKLICDECQNAEICKYRDECKQISAAVANLKTHKELDNGGYGICNVPDVPYIDVVVNCRYFRGALVNVAKQLDYLNAIPCVSTPEASL